MSKPNFFQLFWAAIVITGVLGLAGPAAAQTTKLIGRFKDWDANLMTQNGEKACFMISTPKTTAPGNVRRGETYITVTFRPKASITNEVNFVAGYPFRKDSTVTTSIGSRDFKLFTSGDAAWSYDAKSDNALVKAMKAGSSLVVRGTSSRGTDTRDRYSLIGFTAAYNAASKACAG